MIEFPFLIKKLHKLRGRVDFVGSIKTRSNRNLSLFGINGKTFRFEDFLPVKISEGDDVTVLGKPKVRDNREGFDVIAYANHNNQITSDRGKNGIIIAIFMSISLLLGVIALGKIFSAVSFFIFLLCVIALVSTLRRYTAEKSLSRELR